MAHQPRQSAHRRNRIPFNCSVCYPREPIYDEPYVFYVRSNRSASYSLPCRACLREAKQQQQQQQQRRRPSTVNTQYQNPCSRLRSKSAHFDNSNRPKTALKARCTWENFMNKRSKHAIPTPYALCDLTKSEQELENRPPFVNYGGRYNDKTSGEKRTFNSLAVHRLKHDEVEGKRIREILRERRLRHEAEDIFRRQGHPS